MSHVFLVPSARQKDQVVRAAAFPIGAGALASGAGSVRDIVKGGWHDVSVSL